MAAPISTSARVAATMPAAALGGMLAATLDTLLARPQLGRFLSEGASSLWLFLATLYGAALSLLLLALSVVALLLHRHTLAGRLWRDDGAQTPPVIAPWALLLCVVVASGIFGATLYPVTLQALLHFHHRDLIAILVGVFSGGLALLAIALGLFVLAQLPSGKRTIALRFGGPRGLYALGWTLGLLGVAGAVALRLLSLQRVPQLTPALRALQLSLWAPILGLCALAIGHGIGRTLARLVPRGEANRGLDSHAALVILPSLAVLAAAGVVASMYVEPLRILDWRPLRTAAIAIVGALIVLKPLVRRASRRSFIALLLPIVLYAAALSLGRGDRVRKAALALAPLSEKLVVALATAADLDGDGVAGRWAIGGSDCDDLDAERHPGAFDWPDNGIDENCNGHDATATPGNAAQTSTLAPPPGLLMRPNIVLITIDALRADHVSAYGYKRRTTPALDALANDRDGVIFDSAWAHAPSTRYSVPAILTGRYPSTIAWGPPHVHWPPEVLPENRLLSEMLADRGYSTTALLTYHYFERSWGLSQGFADYDTHLMNLHSLGGDPAATSGTSSRELADLALQKLATLALAPPEKPFFLWLHFYDPHYRYEPHPPPPGEASFGDSEIDLYDGEIRYTDQHIGRVLFGLRQSPAWPRTAVFVTADHGEGFGEHGLGPDRRHGYHLYANQTRVPLLMRLPGLGQSGQHVASPVGHVDLTRTIVHLAGGEDPGPKEPQLLGRSLLPVLSQSGIFADGVVFQEVMYEGPTVRKALVSAHWHLIQNLIPDGTTELYDLQADPNEDHDRFGLEPQIEGSLSQRLSAWLDDSAVPPNFAQRLAGNLSTTPLTAATPLSAHIGDFLDVVAVDAPSNVVDRGESIVVTVIYRVAKRIPPGYHLFTHLRGAGGRSLNLDHDFVDGLVPPQRLQPGQYVRDVVRLSLPPWFPSGQAVLQLGLFRRDYRVPVSGPEQAVLSADRAVKATTLQVR